MTPDDFKRYGIRMYGRKHWRREYSINLGLDPSTVWRMSTRAQDIPVVVEVAIRGLLEKHKLLTAHARDKRVVEARMKHRYQGKLTTGARVNKPVYTPPKEKMNDPPPDPTDQSVAGSGVSSEDAGS